MVENILRGLRIGKGDPGRILDQAGRGAVFSRSTPFGLAQIHLIGRLRVVVTAEDITAVVMSSGSRDTNCERIA